MCTVKNSLLNYIQYVHNNSSLTNVSALYKKISKLYTYVNNNYLLTYIIYMCSVHCENSLLNYIQFTVHCENALLPSNPYKKNLILRYLLLFFGYLKLDNLQPCGEMETLVLFK